MKIRTEKVIEVSDWDDLVRKTYGRLYSFQQQGEGRDRGRFSLSVPDCSEDEELPDTVEEKVNAKSYGVRFAAWLARDPLQELPGQDADYELNLWWTRSFYPDVNAVANDLHARGLLAAGEYSIDIDW